MQAQNFDTSKSIIQKIESEDLHKRGISLYIKRDDLIHPEVSGNKWRKLKYNFEQFKSSKKEQVLTFGGAYSNHLLAVASACKMFDIPSIGILRGEELNENSNSILSRCNELGMKLHPISRLEYGMRSDKEYLEELAIEFPNSYMIPEGGANYMGIIGCQEILNENNQSFDHVFIAQGTTTTSCGVMLSANLNKLHVIPVLKGFDSVSEMKNLLSKTGFEADVISELLEKVEVHSEYHFGGYGKFNEELIEFIIKSNENWNLPLDKIYTAKAFYGLMEELKNPIFDHSTILFVHTGGYWS